MNSRNILSVGSFALRLLFPLTLGMASVAVAGGFGKFPAELGSEEITLPFGMYSINNKYQTMDLSVNDHSCFVTPDLYEKTDLSQVIHPFPILIRVDLENCRVEGFGIP